VQIGAVDRARHAAGDRHVRADAEHEESVTGGSAEPMNPESPMMMYHDDSST
jgi:hypothetical protein